MLQWSSLIRTGQLFLIRRTAKNGTKDFSLLLTSLGHTSYVPCTNRTPRTVTNWIKKYVLSAEDVKDRRFVH